MRRCRICHTEIAPGDATARWQVPDPKYPSGRVFKLLLVHKGCLPPADPDDAVAA